MKIIFTMLFLVSILASCASTKMTSFKDTEFNGRVYKKIIVFPDITSLENRMSFEEKACSKLAKFNVDCIRSLTLFPPTRNYDANEIHQKLVENGIDSMLSISLIDAYTRESYVPPSSKTTGYVSGYGNTATYNSYTTTSGGYTVSKPTIKFKIELFDVGSGKKAFVADSTTNGGGTATISTLLTSLATKVTSQLFEQGLIQEKIVNTAP